MKEDIQEQLTQINSSFGNSLTDEYNDDFNLPYAAFILPVASENTKKDSFQKAYFPKAKQQLRIIIELEENKTETGVFQECFDTALDLQNRLLDKYYVDSEFIQPLKSIHNKNKKCYESVLTITEQ